MTAHRVGALRLILLRHAKSSWKDPYLADHVRPLNSRGKSDCPRMVSGSQTLVACSIPAKALVERGWIPELVLSSSSRRTVNTWELMAPHVSPTPAVWFAHELYHSPPLPWVQAEAEGGRLSKIETLMLVGHNPWWEMAAEELTDRSVVLKTASALLMESELDVGASWDDALRAQWTIDKLIHPRELMFTEQD
eukprot:m.303758 g.303758  ORF g.303758 m.303758 type:complete len:193 (+) comp27306_c0_seq2:103-681(+)